jgi:hypothetical protein
MIISLMMGAVSSTHKERLNSYNSEKVLRNLNTWNTLMWPRDNIKIDVREIGWSDTN